MLGLVFDFVINLDLHCFKFSNPTPSFSQPLHLSSSKINQNLNFVGGRYGMLGLVFDFVINLDLHCFKFSDPTPSFSQPLRLSSSKINQSLNFEHTHLQFSLKIITAPSIKSMDANFMVIFLKFMFPGVTHFNTNCFPSPITFCIPITLKFRNSFVL